MVKFFLSGSYTTKFSGRVLDGTRIGRFKILFDEKYTKIKDNISIFCTKDHGPWTYSFGFRKENKMKKVQHGGASINNGYKNGSNIIVNNSSKIVYFDITEVEVYKIIIIN